MSSIIQKPTEKIAQKNDLGADKLRELANDLAIEVIDDGIKSPELISELRNIANFIESTKGEVAALRPIEMTNTDLPGATHVLDVITKTSEQACHAILSCAEDLTGIALNVPDEALQDNLNGIAMRIFEASNFDDLNGQRIFKVIKTLKEIETRVGRLVSLFGADLDGGVSNAKPSNPLEGPADSPAATSQEMIDALLKG